MEIKTIRKRTRKRKNSHKQANVSFNMLNEEIETLEDQGSDDEFIDNLKRKKKDAITVKQEETKLNNKAKVVEDLIIEYKQKITQALDDNNFEEAKNLLTKLEFLNSQHTTVVNKVDTKTNDITKIEEDISEDVDRLLNEPEPDWEDDEEEISDVEDTLSNIEETPNEIDTDLEEDTYENTQDEDDQEDNFIDGIEDDDENEATTSFHGFDDEDDEVDVEDINDIENSINDEIINEDEIMDEGEFNDSFDEGSSQNEVEEELDTDDENEDEQDNAEEGQNFGLDIFVDIDDPIPGSQVAATFRGKQLEYLSGFYNEGDSSEEQWESLLDIITSDLHFKKVGEKSTWDLDKKIDIISFSKSQDHFQIIVTTENDESNFYLLRL